MKETTKKGEMERDQGGPPSKSFGIYKREDQKGLRDQQRTISPTMKRILELWEAVKFINDDKCSPDYGNDYGEGYTDGYNASFHNLIEHMAKNIGHGAGEIERFSILLADHQEEPNFRHKAGLFLSALINSGTDPEYLIHTEDLDGIDCLGFKNRKNITINGNVGELLGNFMTDGEITVEGKASRLAATHMEGGRILVKGDAGDNLGFRMDGGEITVEGDADGLVGADMTEGKITVKGEPGESVGCNMEGGEIHIGCDDPPDIANNRYTEGGVKHGKIYHKGKLIVDE